MTVCSNKGAHACKIQTRRTIKEYKIPRIRWQAFNGLTEKKFSAWLTPCISIKACKLNPTRDEVNAAWSLTDKR